MGKHDKPNEPEKRQKIINRTPYTGKHRGEAGSDVPPRGEGIQDIPKRDK